MKALTLKDRNQFVIEDVPEPNQASDEVLVAVKACGICGSDVHGMDGSTGRRRPPIIMGHEAAGVVVEIGSSVRDWAPGDRVTFDSTIYCGDCDYCRNGEINLCDHRRVMGVSCEEYRQDGAFAEFVAVPQRALYRLPTELPFETAALVEPLSIAFHALRRMNPAQGDTAVVVGSGIIGLLLIQTLHLAGCERVIVVDVASDRLELASGLGATDIINSKKVRPVEAILNLTRGRGADVAFEAVGCSATVDLAIRSVRKGGSVTLIGNLAAKVDLPLQLVVTRELRVWGSCASQGEYPKCLNVLAQGAVRVSPLISAIAPLDEGPAWFARLHSREPGLLKVILCPGELQHPGRKAI